MHHLPTEIVCADSDWIAGMYDVALSPEQVMAMYRTVFRDAAAPPTVFSSKRMTISGKVCSFPADIPRETDLEPMPKSAGSPCLPRQLRTVGGETNEKARSSFPSRASRCAFRNAVASAGQRPIEDTTVGLLDARNLKAEALQACADLPPGVVDTELESPDVKLEDDHNQVPPQPAAQAPAPADSMYTIRESGLVTQDERACLSPVKYNGQLVSGCVTFAAVPNTPLCWVETPQANGTWNVCKQSAEVSLRGITTNDALNRVSSSRQACILPVVHQVRHLISKSSKQAAFHSAWL